MSALSVNVNFLRFRNGWTFQSILSLPLPPESSGFGQKVGGLGEPMGRSLVISCFVCKCEMIEECCRDRPTACGERLQR